MRTALNATKTLKPRIRRNAAWPRLWSIRLQVGDLVLHSGAQTPEEAYRRFMESPMVYRIQATIT